MLGKFSREEEFHGSLDLFGGKGPSFVVSDELGGLNGDSLEDVVDEGVHNVHGLLADADVAVDLFEHFVDVNGECLGPASSDLSISSGSFSLGAGFGSFADCLLGNHLKGVS